MIGAPFEVGDTTWTLEDKLNYDAVGNAAIAGAGGEGLSAAHKTQPLPSYVEVTSLASGRTNLARVERRVPMSNDRLVELSPGAGAQLGLAGSDRPAVHVRRVNPREQERAMLRTGGRAPEPMATPGGLLDALNRKLAASVLAPQLALAPVSAPMAHAVAAPQPAQAPVAKPAAAPAPLAKPALAQQPASAPVHGTLVVQVAALSIQDRASGIAGKIGGRSSAAGRLWRVRLGPFGTHREAEATLAKARVAGYSDARIQRAD